MDFLFQFDREKRRAIARYEFSATCMREYLNSSTNQPFPPPAVLDSLEDLFRIGSMDYLLCGPDDLVIHLALCDIAMRCTTGDYDHEALVAELSSYRLIVQKLMRDSSIPEMLVENKKRLAQLCHLIIQESARAGHDTSSGCFG